MAKTRDATKLVPPSTRDYGRPAEEEVSNKHDLLYCDAREYIRGGGLYVRHSSSPARLTSVVVVVGGGGGGDGDDNNDVRANALFLRRQARRAADRMVPHTIRGGSAFQPRFGGQSELVQNSVQNAELRRTTAIGLLGSYPRLIPA